MKTPKPRYAVGNINSDKRGTGARASGGKVSFSIVPLHLLAGVARVFMYGLVKYAPWNWAKGMPWNEPYDCTMRHLFKWWYLGEDIDPESGEHHLDHAMCNIMMLRHYAATYTDGDNRPPGAITAFPEAFDMFTKSFDLEDIYARNPNLRPGVTDEE